MNRIIVDLNKDKVITIKDSKNNIIRLDNTNNAKTFFDMLSNYKIKDKKYNSNTETLIIENKEGIFYINNYLDLRQENYFNKLNEAISKYNKSKISHVKLYKSFIIAPIVAVGLTSGIIASSKINADNEEKKLSSNDNNVKHSYSIVIDDEDIIYDNEVFFDETNTKEKKQDNILDNDIDPLTNAKTDKEYEKIIEKQVSNKKENEINELPIQKENNTQENNDKEIYEFNNLEEYDETIKLAADIYNIDYEVAKQVVIKHLDEITSNKGNVSLFMPYNSLSDMIKSDTDRIKDLKDKGVIDPNIINSGIFLTIYDYAYTLKTMGKNIKECKMDREEREKFILNIAENIYGVKDDNIKALLLSATWIESNTGTSPMGISKNNIGGNTGANGFLTFDTFEQGACEYVYNMLRTINRTFYSDTSKLHNNLIYKIGLIYCNETWQDWGREVSKQMNYVLDSGKIKELEEKNDIKTR